MLQSSDTEAKVNAEVALLQGIVASLCPLEVFSADIECHLRTGKEEDVGRTAQTDCITHIHRDSNLLLLHGLFFRFIIELGRTVVVEYRSIHSQTDNRQGELNRRTEEPAGLVCLVEHITAEMKITHIQTCFQTELQRFVRTCRDRGKD